MASLKGFPPSNTISGWHFEEDVIHEIPIKIKDLKPEEKFKLKLGGVFNEYMRMENDRLTGDPRGICYKVDSGSTMPHPNLPGVIYSFHGEREVIWLSLHDINCCKHCGLKLTSDALSEKFGDWCSNEECYMSEW